MQSNNDRGWAVTFLLTALLLSPACSESPETPPSDTTPIVDMGEPPADMTPRGSCNWMEHVQDNQCVPCPKGTERLAGDDPSGPDTECEPTVCEENQHVVDERCVPCPPGSTREAGDVEFGPNTACEATLCNTNERVSAHECIPCRAGTINAPFDDATGDSTLCDPLFCPPDHKVVDHRCVNCELGGANEAGDSAAGGDTRCDVREYCQQDHRISGGRCIACSPGTSNPAGDPSNGGDTQCEPVFCERHFFVSGNLCTPCPEFHWNDEGDDSSGPDTECDDRCLPTIGIPCLDFFKGQMFSPAPQDEASFGQVIAVDGDTLAVGSPMMDNPPRGTPGHLHDSGVVHIFTRDGEGWAEEQTIYPPVSGSLDMFGNAIALDGDTLIIGAPGEDSDTPGVGAVLTGSGADGSGAAYVYRRIDGTWTFELAIKPSQPAYRASFGTALRLQDGILVIGAPNHSYTTPENGNRSSAGAAYVFEKGPDGAWIESAILTASNADRDDHFGSVVDIASGRIAISALDESSGVGGSTPDPLNNLESSSGAVYIFEEQNKQWVETQYVKARYPDRNDQFGYTLSLQADRLVIGAPRESSSSTVVDGDQLSNDARDAGAAYVFEYTGTAWEQRAYLKAPNAQQGDKFGARVFLSRDWLFISATSEDNPAAITTDSIDFNYRESGAVYLFERNPQSWSYTHFIKSPSPASRTKFGSEMELDGGRLLVGEIGAYVSSPFAGNVQGGAISIYDIDALP